MTNNKAQFEFGLRSARFWIKSNTDIWTAQLNRYNIYWKFGTKEENTKKTRRKEEKTKCKEENNETNQASIVEKQKYLKENRQPISAGIQKNNVYTVVMTELVQMFA